MYNVPHKFFLKKLKNTEYTYSIFFNRLKFNYANYSKIQIFIFSQLKKGY